MRTVPVDSSGAPPRLPVQARISRPPPDTPCSAHGPPVWIEVLSSRTDRIRSEAQAPCPWVFDVKPSPTSPRASRSMLRICSLTRPRSSDCCLLPPVHRCHRRYPRDARPGMTEESLIPATRRGVLLAVRREPFPMKRRGCVRTERATGPSLGWSSRPVGVVVAELGLVRGLGPVSCTMRRRLP